MPYDGNGRGTFEPEGDKDKRIFQYEVVNWVKAKEWPRRRKRITPDDLPKLDFLVVKVHPIDDPDTITYDTIWGPFDDFDFLEGFLAYDYGDDGTLNIEYTAPPAPSNSDLQAEHDRIMGR